MTDIHSDHDPRRELARRVGGGIEVTLYWNGDDGRTSVEIFHAATGQTLHFAVPRRHALDAFYHPFAHLPAPADEGLGASSPGDARPRRAA
jgi:hypothetical protein